MRPMQDGKRPGAIVLMVVLLSHSGTGMSVETQAHRYFRGSEPVADPAGLRVEVHQAQATLHVKEAPLQQVLLEMARQGGFAVYLQEALEEPVTEAFDRLPLDYALRRLLRDRNFVWVSDPGNVQDERQERLVEVRVLSQTPAVRREAPQFALEGEESETDPGELETLPTLVEQALHAGDPALREQALQQLRGRVEPEMTDPLLQALEDPHADVRKTAVLALGAQQEETRVIDALTQLLHSDPDETVRGKAALALWDLQGERAADSLGAALQDDSPRVRARVVEALGEIGGQTATTVLRHALQDEDDTVRDSAEKVLKGRLEEVEGG